MFPFTTVNPDDWVVRVRFVDQKLTEQQVIVNLAPLDPSSDRGWHNLTEEQACELALRSIRWGRAVTRGISHWVHLHLKPEDVISVNVTRRHKLQPASVRRQEAARIRELVWSRFGE